MIEINNLTGQPILGRAVDKKIFSTVAKKVLLGENRGTETLSLAFVGKEEMEKLNKKYRKKDGPTDVLSFSNSPYLMPEVSSEGLGEIVICPEVVKENAGKEGITFKKEMLKVFIHGILHLCGYDHEKSEKEAEEMEKAQEKYLSNVK
jgi:probable rRNA maturation factor